MMQINKYELQQFFGHHLPEWGQKMVMESIGRSPSVECPFSPDHPEAAGFTHLGMEFPRTSGGDPYRLYVDGEARVYARERRGLFYPLETSAPESVRARVRRKREVLGISCTELALFLGVDTTRVVCAMDGAAGDNPKTLSRLEAALDSPEAVLRVRLVGTQLRRLRIAAGLTQTDLAERIGAGQGRISEYELGERQPGLDTLRALAGVLGPITIHGDGGSE